MSSARRKKVKKLLMGDGVPRNTADIVSSGIMYSHLLRSIKRNRIEHNIAERRRNDFIK